MVLVKRYPNRKLYDTGRKRYITLEGIAALIKEGQEVQVVDYTTGEDLTTLTLSQIIFEQEKKEGGFLPKTVLAGLVQSGGETLTSLRRALASPLDLLYHVDEEIERRMMRLIQTGQIEEEAGLALLDKLLAETPPPAETPLSGEAYIKKILARRGIPTRDELEKLTTEIEDLAAKLDSLAESESAGDAAAGNSP